MVYTVRWLLFSPLAYKCRRWSGRLLQWWHVIWHHGGTDDTVAGRGEGRQPSAVPYFSGRAAGCMRGGQKRLHWDQVHISAAPRGHGESNHTWRLYHRGNQMMADMKWKHLFVNNLSFFLFFSPLVWKVQPPCICLLWCKCQLIDLFTVAFIAWTFLRTKAKACCMLCIRKIRNLLCVVQVKIAYVNFVNHCYVDTEVEMKEIYTSNHIWKLFVNFTVDMARVSPLYHWCCLRCVLLSGVSFNLV